MNIIENLQQNAGMLMFVSNLFTLILLKNKLLSFYSFAWLYLGKYGVFSCNINLVGFGKNLVKSYWVPYVFWFEERDQLKVRLIWKVSFSLTFKRSDLKI